MFKLNHKANKNLTSLQAFPDGILMSDVERVFGPSPSDWEEEEKGYYPYTTWAFESERGVVTLYARWGALRIGGHDRETALAFRDWLMEQVKRA